jgi:hypothetical protein
VSSKRLGIRARQSSMVMRAMAYLGVKARIEFK